MIKTIDVKIKLLNGGVLPVYKTEGAAGVDICASIDGEIAPMSRGIVPTGISIAIPEGYEGQVRPRSGLAFNEGVTVLNTPGTIDSDYRGEIKIALFNTSAETFRYKKGDRVAQIIFAPIIRAVFNQVDELTTTERGNGGFGSTGKS